jgi:hypothetical protein
MTSEREKMRKAIEAARSHIGPCRPGDNECGEQDCWDGLTKAIALLAPDTGTWDDLVRWANANGYGNATDSEANRAYAAALHTDHAARVAELEAEVDRWRTGELAAIAELVTARDRATAAEGEVGRLRGVLERIRDSTFRNAVTLRGMADQALAQQSPGVGSEINESKENV